MASETNILLVTTDNNAVRDVKSTLLNNKGMVLAGICRELSQIVGYLSNKNIHSIIVDIDIDPTRVLYDLGKILHNHPEIYVIIICSSFHKDLVLRAMQLGARNFLEKQNISKDLSDVIIHLSQTSKRKKEKNGAGTIISILSAGGGCGATTVAVNLASELQIFSSQPALIIDMDYCYGAVSSYLGIKSQYGIADVINHKGIIDEDLIRSSVFSYMDNFHVLVSPGSIETSKTNVINNEQLPVALEPCRELYRFTVIDAPRMSSQQTVNLASHSDIILVVYQLTVKDVHFAHKIVESLTKAGIAPKKIISVANRFKKRGPFIRLEDSKKVIGLNSCFLIRNEWKTAMKSVNKGKPLSMVSKRSKLRSDFHMLAERIINSQSVNNSTSG